MSGPTQANADTMLQHVSRFAEIGDRSQVNPIGQQLARAYITETLNAFGWNVTAEPVEIRNAITITDSAKGAFPLTYRRRLHGENLIATRTERTQIVIGAHYDTVAGSPGADDNGSGLAVLLELARILPPTAPVELAFYDMEEIGHQGSLTAARRAKNAGTKLMICLDAIGFYRAEPHSQNLPFGSSMLLGPAARQIHARDDRGNFTLLIHRATTTAAAAEITEAAARAGLDIITVRDPRPDGIRGRIATFAAAPLSNLDRSDHASYWANGIPALLLTGTGNLRNPHYHQATDTPETLDYRRIQALADALSTVTIATSP